MSFLKSFDEILQDLLTTYQNNIPDIDISQGSLAFVKSTVSAAEFWNAYRYMSYIAAQVFPDLADSENMEHHGWIWGILRKSNETDQALLDRILDRIRKPPAGGNAHDYKVWAESIDDVAEAYVYPLAQGLGTVDIVIVANIATGSEIPSGAKVTEVQKYIDDVRPVTATWSIVFPVAIETQNVQVDVYGTGLDLTEIQSDIEAYLDAMIPDQVLYKSKIVEISMANGCTNAIVNTPASDATPTRYNMFRKGTVTVTQQ